MRQLHLFKGRRQRGVRAPTPLEFEIHCVMADIIKRWINPQWKGTHLPFGEKRPMPTAIRLKRMGVTPGWPDFMFVGPKMQMFWLELKRPRKGHLSEEQSAIAAHLIACGHSYLATSSVDDAVATMKDFGILQSKIELS